MTHPAQLDPRVKAANIKAAANLLAEAAARVEMLEADLNALDHEPPSAARVARRFALRFRMSSAERQERQAIHAAHRAGLQDLTEYPAEVDGQPCTVFMDGPTVSLWTE